MAKKKKKKVSLKKTVETLALIAEEHLSTMPEEEREERVAAMSRRIFTPRRDKLSTPSKTEHTPEYRSSKISAFWRRLNRKGRRYGVDCCGDLSS